MRWVLGIFFVAGVAYAGTHTTVGSPFVEGHCVKAAADSSLVTNGAECGTGGTGASSLAVTTGTSAGFSTITSSPTAVLNTDQAMFSVSLRGGSTAFMTIKHAVTSLAANTVLTSTHSVVLADASGGGITITLPTAVGIAGRIYTVKRTSSGANTVTVDTTSSQTIDGATTVVLNAQYTSLDLVSDGANWKIL